MWARPSSGRRWGARCTTVRLNGLAGWGGGSGLGFHAWPVSVHIRRFWATRETGFHAWPVSFHIRRFRATPGSGVPPTPPAPPPSPAVQAHRNSARSPAPAQLPSEPVLITVEGIDGAGKSTLVEGLKTRFDLTVL